MGDKLTKEELKQIYHINQEIRMWQRELERIQCKSLIKGQEMTGMPHVSGISNKVADLAIEKSEVEAIITGKLAEIQLQRRKIIEYINSIDDSLMRQIVFLRNVSCMSWNQVAREIGEENTADSIRMLHKRFLEREEIK